MLLPPESPGEYREGLGDSTGRVLYWHDEEGVCQGWLEYRLAPGWTCELVNFEVSPEWRRRGIATALIEKVSALPEVRVVFGYLQSNNQRMLALCKNLGMTLHFIPGYYGSLGDAYLFFKRVKE